VTRTAGLEVAQLEAVISTCEQTLKKRKLSLSERTDAQQQLVEAKRQREEAAPRERRYMTQDATVEALAVLLAGQPRGLLVYRDELAGLLHSFDKNGHESDRAFYLEAWDGDKSYQTDRIGRGAVHVPALALSVIGGIQPGKLARWIAEALEDGDGADGLLQRLQLLVHVTASPTWRPPRGLDTGARDRAYRAHEWLDRLPLHLDALGATTRQGEPDGIPWIGLDPGAQAVMSDWRAEFERRLRGEELAELPAYAAHVAKYRSLAPSLALLGHLLDVAAGDAAPGPVTELATRRGLDLVDYFDLHARRTYGVPSPAPESTPDGEPNVSAAARALAKRIKDGHVRDGDSTRDVERHGWSHLGSRQAVHDAAGQLAAFGWLRIERRMPSAGGGRPTDLVRLHPELRGQP
jgi:hypothetical protein